MNAFGYTSGACCFIRWDSNVFQSGRNKIFNPGCARLVLAFETYRLEVFARKRNPRIGVGKSPPPERVVRPGRWFPPRESARRASLLFSEFSRGVTLHGFTTGDPPLSLTKRVQIVLGTTVLALHGQRFHCYFQRLLPVPEPAVTRPRLYQNLIIQPRTDVYVRIMCT
jgi:hypothetical protein